jgi:SAM-dependent methyltransferase
MKALPDDTLLDAGGNVGKGFTALRNFFKKVIVVDLSMGGLQKARVENENIHALIGNVCNIPLKDRSVDFIFSNALIEHIKKEERQLFAEEVRRVAKKGYFISTPNYWFPVEPHYLFPGWQYLPKRLRLFINRYFTLGFCKKGLYEDIDLLSRKELRRLFPEANIIGMSVITGCIPESLICWYQRKEKYD